MRKGRRERIEKGSRERIEKRERDKKTIEEEKKVEPSITFSKYPLSESPNIIPL